MSHFDRIADKYNSPVLRIFPFSADRLVTMADLKPGLRVLDVATGTGAVAFAAAQLIKPGGRVQAIDTSEPMITQAEKNKQKLASDNTDIHLEDAREMAFRSEYFDVVLSGFGLNYIKDTGQAIEQCYRVSKPGTAGYFSVFGVDAFNPLIEKISGICSKAGIDTSDFIHNIEKYAEPDRLKTDFTKHHWQVTGLKTVQMGYHLANGQECWELLWLIGLEAILVSLDDDTTQNLKEKFITGITEEISGLSSDDGIWVSIPVNYIAVSRP